MVYAIDQAQECMSWLVEGSDQIWSTLQTNQILDSAGSIEKRVNEAYEKMNDVAGQIDTTNSDTLLPELKQIDVLLRREAEDIVDTKNLSTELTIELFAGSASSTPISFSFLTSCPTSKTTSTLSQASLTYGDSTICSMYMALPS